MSEEYGKFGWWFDSQWPPGANQAKWIAQVEYERTREKGFIGPEKLAKLAKILDDMGNLFMENGRWKKEKWVAEMMRCGTLKPYHPSAAETEEERIAIDEKDIANRLKITKTDALERRPGVDADGVRLKPTRALLDSKLTKKAWADDVPGWGAER